jgi:hypothetical protein
MRQRNACIRGRCYGGTDAGHNLERHPCRGKRFGFFTTTPKHEGVSSLQPDNTLAALRVCHQQVIDPPLRHTVQVFFFANVQLFRNNWGWMGRS